MEGAAGKFLFLLVHPLGLNEICNWTHKEWEEATHYVASLTGGGGEGDSWWDGSYEKPYDRT